MLFPATPTFSDLLTEVVKRGWTARSRKHYALDRGVNESALLRYADGAVSVYERVTFETVLLNCDWALNFVVDQVKSRREKKGAA